MSRPGVLVAIDSVGVDPLGHQRAESVYAQSRFLFPAEASGETFAVPGGAFVETDVTQGLESGAIECALTYTSIFTGISAVARHGLMQGLGLKDGLLEGLLAERNLFALYERACLANAVFPASLPFFREGYVDGLPEWDRARVEAELTWRGEPVRLVGKDKRGFAELFTAAEINQNIFVHAALEAGLTLRTWDDVRAGRALTASMTHALEGEFGLEALGIEPLPQRTPAEAARVLAGLASEHEFVFYKFQLPDLVSHTGQVELARAVWDTTEAFLEVLLAELDTSERALVVTSDHGHLEQVAFTQGHPKTRVPTWYFGPDALATVDRLRTPEAIFEFFAA